jgi:hypothetical protein
MEVPCDAIIPSRIVIENRFELLSSESKSEMLTVAPFNNKAVCMGIEPIVTDKQSIVLTITLTNL